MKKIILLVALLAAVAVVFAQMQKRPSGTGAGRVAGGAGAAPMYAPYDTLSVFPTETSPGEYLQVDPGQLQTLSDQGWQLVAVSPYILRNEEHQATAAQATPLVTQVYSAYYFQRPRIVR